MSQRASFELMKQPTLPLGAMKPLRFIVASGSSAAGVCALVGVDGDVLEAALVVVAGFIEAVDVGSGECCPPQPDSKPTAGPSIRTPARSVVAVTIPSVEHDGPSFGFSAHRPSVLVSDVHRSLIDVSPGLVAQGESVRLTRGRSLVRSQPGPPPSSQVRRGFEDF
jgi:hypothetical protein